MAEPADLAACDYLSVPLTVFVVGASGDLAKKKTYPSLFDLYRHGFFPKGKTTICGYARSEKSDKDFRESLRANLEKKASADEATSFLDLCIYRKGAYDSAADVKSVFTELEQREKNFGGKANRLFYFAIPPTVFVPIGKAIKDAVIAPLAGPAQPATAAVVEKKKPRNRIIRWMGKSIKEEPKPVEPAPAEPAVEVGWSRLIVEKPFGHDSESFEVLRDAMAALYTEDFIYRIDHYLGKEMVQNLLVLRFANAMFEPLWNRNHIKTVTITFKENFGTKGRGGYFDDYGIIRDVIQNHLLQVLSLVAMEPPVAVAGEGSANYVRDEKVKVLNCIDPIKLEDCVLGQYMAAKDGSEVAYTEDPTVPDDSVTPTFATVVMWIKNPRWEGVPFIIKAGKALNERKAEVRIQFKEASGAEGLFEETPNLQPQELVMRLQPDEAVYMRTNVKSPGLGTAPVASELNLTYKSRYDVEIFDAYTRLILEVLRGSQSYFVRDDELKAAWAIFTPLLHQIENDKVKPIPYEYGGRGPKESDELIEKLGYAYHGGKYKWNTALD